MKDISYRKMKTNQKLRRSFNKKYENVLKAAKEGEQRCLNGNRWRGNAILMVIDAALDSIVLNYFKIVVPRVKMFFEKYVKSGQVRYFSDFLEHYPKKSQLMKIMNNERVWRVALEICRNLNAIKEKRQITSDFAALRFWAQTANYYRWKSDVIGRIYGVGLITFQYLRTSWR